LPGRPVFGEAGTRIGLLPATRLPALMPAYTCSAKDEDHNNAVALKEYLESRP
jgi:uncharacterized protein YeaO (DUF488 family)